MWTKTEPKKWNEEDIKQLLKMESDGFTRKEIAEAMNRTEVAISIKLKRLKKKSQKYNESHLEEKRKINKEFEEYLNPREILDLFSGGGTHYKPEITITNDKNEKLKADYHMDSLKLLCKFYTQNKKFDFIDLDPFGSAYDNFDLAIKLAKKGIAITLGELGHKRFKRLDFIKTRYNIKTMEEFTIDNLIKEIQNIGLQNKKELIVWKQREWKNIGRVWFTIKPHKELSQWKREEEER